MMVVTCLDCIHRVAMKLAKDECHLIPPIGEIGWAKVSPTDVSCSHWNGIGVDNASLDTVAPLVPEAVKDFAAAYAVKVVPKKKR